MIVPSTLGTIDIQELHPRFQNKVDRVNGGRANELVFHELEDVFTTYYAWLLHDRYDTTTFRYVRFFY